MCAFMWLWNRGEAFHPHSVAMERRHALYQVVCANTVCKHDFAVKSVSEFIAPRGSSSDKYLTILVIVGAVAGFLGCNRWYAVGDASFLQASLAQAGCFFLFVVAIFEVDVSPRAFLEIKLMITGWFLQMLDTEKHLNFELTQYSDEMLKFLVESEELKHLYDEYTPAYRINHWLPVFDFQFSMHMLGASAFVTLVTASIILNEWEEERVAWITFITFFCFGAMGYLTGSYFPVDGFMRGTILLWNPFVKERDFLIKLQRAVNAYCAERDARNGAGKALPTSSGNSGRGTTPKRRKSVTSTVKSPRSSPRRMRSASNAAPVEGVISDAEMKAAKAKVLRENFFIRQASKRPKTYLRVLSHMFMVIELSSLMTPQIAMGIQWITALCGSTPPATALWHTFFTIGTCLWNHDYVCDALQQSCVIAANATAIMQ